MKKYIFLIIYYGFARYLPASYSRYGGSIAKKIRRICCKNIFLECGSNVNIERKAFFGRGENIKIGDNSGIGVNCQLLDNTIIGKNVMMGPNCYFMPKTHLFDRTDIPMCEQGRSKEMNQLIIEDDVWIGRDVMIIGSRIIKKGTIIGARTVLTKNFPEYSIVGGNPSKIIRSRK